MKKILFTIVTFLSLAVSVNASSFSVKFVGNNTFTKDITLQLQVDNLLDFNGACNGLCGLVGNLEYDKEKIELVSIQALQNFDLTNGSRLVLYKSTGVQNGTKILSMKFKNKGLAKNETTKISFTNIIASDGDKDISTSNVSKIIKFINEKSNSTTTNKTEIKKSNNNYLSSLTLSKGNIVFDKNTLVYELVVDYEYDVIEVNSISEDAKAIVTGNGNYNLAIGENTILIKVKAEDNSERIYTLNINRKEKVILDNENENTQKEQKDNYTLPIVIVASILTVLIISIVIYAKKKAR